MTEPGPDLLPAPPGDTYVALTRIIYRDLPEHWGDARRCVDRRTGVAFMVVRPGLTRQQRRDAVRAALHPRAPGYAAVALYAGDLARRAAQPAQRVMHAIQAIPGAVNLPQPAVITATATIAVIVTAGGAVKVSGLMDAPHHAGPPAGSAAWHRQHPVHIDLPPKPLSYLGVYEPTSPASYAGIDQFARACGRRPNLALYYSGWGEPFHEGFAFAAAQAGAIPAVQINPEFSPFLPTGAIHVGTGKVPSSGVSLAGIAAGQFDYYLVAYADAVASYGRAVVISFAPEVNGNWYPWSHQPPADYVAAWRHIVGVFNRQGARNVTWMWTINQVGGGAVSPAAWWPGAAYVDWVGIDGYYRHPRDTWDYVFAPTIGAVREFTSAPVLIAETAIGPAGTEPSQLRDMYSNIRAGNYLGLVWFDENKPGLPYRLENPGPNAALIRATFRDETAGWRLQHQHRKVAG